MCFRGGTKQEALSESTRESTENQELQFRSNPNGSIKEWSQQKFAETIIDNLKSCERLFCPFVHFSSTWCLFACDVQTFSVIKPDPGRMAIMESLHCAILQSV